jgi:alpha-1,2-mannosyltransferase
LFVAGALAWMPYGVALAVWQAVTLALYLLSIRAIVAPPLRAAGRDDFLWLLLALAFPAVLINIGHGQNGFLTAALLSGALVVLDRRPIAAGILLGFLVYKPQ